MDKAYSHIDARAMRGVLSTVAESLGTERSTPEECSEVVDELLHRLARRMESRQSPLPYTRDQWIEILRWLALTTAEHEAAGTPEKAWTFVIIFLGGVLSGTIDLNTPPPPKRASRPLLRAVL